MAVSSGLESLRLRCLFLLSHVIIVSKAFGSPHCFQVSKSNDRFLV